MLALLDNKIDYDLNIFQKEELNAENEYEYTGPWYIHVYEYSETYSDPVMAPIELTAEESEFIVNNNSFTNDFWYALNDFWLDYMPNLSPRLQALLKSLPGFQLNFH